jgi:hypothetical protein
MAKVTINGEVFQWDPTRRPMSEALAIEHALKVRYADWEQDVQSGSAFALCGFIWLLWRRDGRDIPFDDIVSGKVDIDLGDFAIEMEPGEPGYEEAQGGGTDPTNPAPEATSTTAASTSPRSANSISGRGRSASSTSTSSKP